MRFVLPWSILATALLMGEALAGNEPRDSDKLSFDRKELFREKRRRLNKRILQERGINLLPDYEQERKLVDVSKDLHPMEVRRLVEKVNNRATTGGGAGGDDFDFWRRFLQDAGSIVPTRAPVAPTPPVPEPTPPAPTPVAPTPTVPAPTPTVPAPTPPAPSPTPPVPSPTPPVPSPTPPVPSPTPPVPSPTPPVTAAPVTAPPPTPVTSAPVAPPTPPDTPAPVAAPTPPAPVPTAAPVPAVTLAPVPATTSAPVVPPTAMPVAAPNRAREVILPVALFNGAEFMDASTYQSKALNWLETSDISSYSDDKIIQRYALGSIYYATNNVSTTFTDLLLGDGVIFPWNTERAWLTDTDECTWSNVRCDNTTGAIVRMDFFGNFMSGEFPPEVTYLKGSLRNLDLSDNPVFTRSETFNSWLGTLTELEILRYEDTNFISSTGVPTEIGNLKKLGFYECSNVRYLGAINGAAFPSDMTQLSYIEMEFNTFNSPIPDAVGSLPNLQFFYARGSSITGNLNFMGNMRAIQEIWTDRNPGLTGNLPTFLGSLSTLGSFSVTRSGWSGPLPTQLGLLTNSLKKMYFYNNAFTGMVPSEWGALSGLEELELQENMLTGQIPQSVCILKITRGLNLEADCEICPLNCCSACVP